MVRVQPVALVLVVVVERQLLAGRVGQLEHRIQRRIQPPGVDLRHDLFAGAAFEAGTRPNSPGRSMRPLTMIGSVTGWALCGESLGFFSAALRQRIDGKGDAVGVDVSLADAQRIDARALVFGIHRQLIDGQVPAAKCDGGLLAGRTAQREMLVINGNSPTVMR